MNWLETRSAKWFEMNRAFVDDGDEKKYAEYLGMSMTLLRHLREHPPQHVLGIDEVGYGAYAGPLVVGAVLSPLGWSHPDLNDSKKVTTVKAREAVLKKLEQAPGARYFVHRTPVEIVDRLGVFKARLASFMELVKSTRDLLPDVLVVIDGNVRIRGVEHVCLPKADSFVPQVMAASLVAKVYRDTEMISMAKQYPQYGFEKHKGYGGNEKHQHVIALKKYGPCPSHRRSFRPIRDLSESST
jgi:ribonuclease HII